MRGARGPGLMRIAGGRARGGRRSGDSFEYQMLYGIRPAEQLRLASGGSPVRVYVPYGSDWYGYLVRRLAPGSRDRKSTRLNSSHQIISYAVFCLKKKKEIHRTRGLESHSRKHHRTHTTVQQT